MTRHVLSITALSLLTACAAVKETPYGTLERTNWGMVERLTVARAEPYDKAAFIRCAKRYLKEKKIFLRDARYGEFRRGVSPGARNVLDAAGIRDSTYSNTGTPKEPEIYEHKDGSITAFNTGNARWEYFGQRFLSFFLKVQYDVTGVRTYVFYPVSSGGIDTGSSANHGAIYPAAAAGVEGKRALSALAGFVDNIESCRADN